MRTLDYFDAAKARLGGVSDYAMAKRLGVSTAYISSVQCGHKVLSDKTAVAIADILNIEPAKVVIAAHIEREKDPAMMAVWSGLMSKISTGFDFFLSGASPRAA